MYLLQTGDVKLISQYKYYNVIPEYNTAHFVG